MTDKRETVPGLAPSVLDGLAARAVAAAANAYAPYSGFKVGAALLCRDGEVFVGCNVENSAYPVTCCAERTAVFSAIAAGRREFEAIAVAGGEVTGGKAAAGEVAGGDYCYPCGSCRQVLAEFASGGFIVLTVNGEGRYRLHRLDELLPYAFKLGK